MAPRDGTQRGILLGFSTRRLSCLVCIRLREPRLLPPPRAVRLNKNNCEEGQKEEHAEASGPFKVMQRVEGLRACSPRFHTAGSAERQFPFPSSALGHFPLTEGTNGPATLPRRTADHLHSRLPYQLIKCRSTSVPVGKHLLPMSASQHTPRNLAFPRDHHDLVNVQQIQGYGVLALGIHWCSCHTGY